MMRLSLFTESDWRTVAPWFPPKGTRSFMDVDWLDAAAGAARYEPDNQSLFVGFRDGEPVSVCSFSLYRDPELRAVVSLLVKPDLRRTGVGRGTVEALGEAFPEVGEFIAYVDPKNAPSLAMLEDFGLVRAPGNVQDRETFVWRRDGSPLPEDWKPPKSRFHR